MGFSWRIGPARTSAGARILLAAALLGSLLGCAPSATRSEVEVSAPLEVIPGHEVHFRPATLCARCHSNDAQATHLRNRAGDPIAPFDLWQGTMMANAARDPLWRAMVSAEIALRPKARAKIEEKCLTCHAPAAAADVRQHGGVLSFAALDSPRLAEVARDGVNCTVCHGISPAGLGSDESFSGGWIIDHSQRAFGPHVAPFGRPMRPQTGWMPTHSTHMRESALCATCHTLFTETLDLEGEPTGSVFPEQTPYLEWRASAYSTEARGGFTPGEDAISCQGCHLPTTEEDGSPIETGIARSPRGPNFSKVRERSPYGQHIFVGGNALVPEILAAHRDEFSVPASADALHAVAARARKQLAERTATVAIDSPRRTEAGLEFSVIVRSLTGHKVPSGHPTRRMWLAVRVLDESGIPLFNSGASDRAGQILGVDGAPLPSERVGGPMRSWPRVVRSPEEVPIFELVMADETGAQTFSLLSAAKTRKDTRLLPSGWREEEARAAGIAAVGVPSDGSFVGGEARVRYQLEIPRGAVTIEATLCYQTLGARFAAELAETETPEMFRFQELLTERGNAPEIVGQVRSIIPDRSR